MEATLIGLFNVLTDNPSAIYVVTTIVGFYLGMKVTMIRVSSARDDLIRMQDEIEYLAEENRKLRTEVRNGFKRDVQENKQ